MTEDPIRRPRRLRAVHRPQAPGCGGAGRGGERVAGDRQQLAVIPLQTAANHSRPWVTVIDRVAAVAAGDESELHRAEQLPIERLCRLMTPRNPDLSLV